eukprot:TRINITY_DN14365_c0_g1_i1.p1 TRINITY_DN14365_c0_g1~~TRINITY_DN14365_c0_g1_i1.p1  ORF type:complete len:127 (-),score=11.65 TRINITY_DN14365_c0_g1_i1:299-679(-)
MARCNGRGDQCPTPITPKLRIRNTILKRSEELPIYTRSESVSEVKTVSKQENTMGLLITRFLFDASQNVKTFHLFVRAIPHFSLFSLAPFRPSLPFSSSFFRKPFLISLSFSQILEDRLQKRQRDL